MEPQHDWPVLLAWTAVVVLVYPLLTLITAEWSRRSDGANRALRRSLRMVQTVLLPCLAVWLVVDKLTDLPADNLLIRLVETAFGIAVLHTVVVAAHGALALLAARSRTPRLLYDLALSVLVVIGAAVIISTVWGFDFTRLLSVIGVGSVIMGLALQSVIGGVVSGVLLLSARQFNIGDWLRTGGMVGRVVQVDWRSVTLRVSDTELYVLHSAMLSSSAFTVIDRHQPTPAFASVVIGYEHSPDKVRAMLLQAARGVPQSVGPEQAGCWVVEYLPSGIRYKVAVSVSDPGRIESATDELLSRIWFVAQRHAMSVAPGKGEGNNLLHQGQTAAQRSELLVATGAFRRSAEALGELGEAAQVQRWRAGETILRTGESVTAVFVVQRGEIRAFMRSATARVELDRLSAGEIFAIREAFRGAASPVDVVAAEESELLSIPTRALQALLDHDPALAADMEIILESRTQALGNLHAAPAQQDPVI